MENYKAMDENYKNVKTYYNKQQWDYCVKHIYNFTTANRDEIICSYTITEYQDYTMLEDMYVAEKWRRNGYFYFLLKHFREQVCERGYGKINLNVKKDNVLAIKLYTRELGFKIIRDASDNRFHWLEADLINI